MQSDEQLFEMHKKVHISYLVMFKDNAVDAPYRPVIRIDPKDIAEQYKQGGAHIFDPSLNGILPAIRYILHLPRIGFDAVDIGSELALAAHDCPHDIILFPSSLAKQLSLSPMINNALLIYEDECETESTHFIRKGLIDAVPLSMLSSGLLSNHWEKIAQEMRTIEEEDCLPAKMEILSDDRFLALPSLFLLNHIQESKKIFDIHSHDPDLFGKIYDISVSIHSHILMLNELEKHPEKDIRKLKRECFESTKIPAIITMMGLPTYQKKITKINAQISDIEREVCRLMAVHRACAREGIVIEYDDAPHELFILLNQLEDHCKSKNISNKYVWSNLRKMGKIFKEHIPVEKGTRMVQSSHITAFTDFPIGLAILPSGTSPLCCYKSISYRPLTPLTRALQIECQKSHQHYIGKRCKIVIAECLDSKDPIRALSEGAWRHYADSIEVQKGLSVVVEEVDSVASLKRLLSHHSDTDILVISAHGAYTRESNIAGLCIGDEIWMGDDNDIRLPPLVMLSACHVCPRGAGSVNVADILLRGGATAVLGTFIPVDVRRNSLLFIRFFSYIQEAMNGYKSYETVLDAWTGVVATNAVNEIVSENEKLHQWYMTPNRDGTPRIFDFTMKRSVGRLHGANIYEETLQILREMALEDGFQDYFDSAINAQGFFPESLFYQMIGFPENIFIYNSINEKYEEKYGEK